MPAQTHTGSATPQEFAMPYEIQAFVRTYLSVVLTTLFVVASCAFITVPYSLGQQPGDLQANAQTQVPRHLT